MKWFILICFVCLVIYGIQHTKSPPGISWKNDLLPVKKRFQKIQSINSVWWHGGVLGTNTRFSIPGPSNYYFEGFIMVSKTESHEWEKTFKWKPIPTGDNIKIDIPFSCDGKADFQTSKDFSDVYLPTGWRGRLFFSNEYHLVYFDITDIDGNIL